MVIQFYVGFISEQIGAFAIVYMLLSFLFSLAYVILLIISGFFHLPQRAERDQAIREAKLNGMYINTEYDKTEAKQAIFKGIFIVIVGLIATLYLEWILMA